MPFIHVPSGISFYVIVKPFFSLTGSPDEWLAENMAHLLILCGDVITSKMLISKAINGRMLELSSLTTSFCVVSTSTEIIVICW